MTKWITSDMHFNHAKIIEYCDRPFETTEEMNEIIIRNWNKKIKKKDIVYVLGDIGFDREQLSKIIPRLNGKKILIKGNHDRFTASQLMSWGFLEIYKKGLLLQGNFFLSHAPKEKNLRYGAKYNIHGHCHSKRKKRYKNVEFFDIGVDGNNFSPYRLQSVQFKMIVRNKLKFLSLHKKQKNDIIL